MSQVQHSVNAEEISLTSNKNDSYILNIRKMHIIRVCKNLKDNECIMLIISVLVSHFIFLFIPCGRPSWLPISFLLHITYTLSYRIVLYRKKLYMKTLNTTRLSRK